ncbi:MAG: citrate synthase [Ruminococcaceae bacterium]|nr:citrate synthase [Oscillospiraceae bacterium]
MSSISHSDIQSLCDEILKNNLIQQDDYKRFEVKRGLRNADGTGVMTGLTRVCSVEGYYIDDGERVPKPGRLIYRGIDMSEIVEGCKAENRFGFEEVAWLLLFGDLPTKEQLDAFTRVLAEARELPDEFIEDLIMKAPSRNIMNKVASSVLGLYTFDENPDDTSLENVLRQSIQLIAQIPTIMSYAYQVKRRAFDHKSMYIHQNNLKNTMAESILRSIRSDKKFTDEEAKILDTCMMIHAEHGGGNNSTFTTRCVSSTGSDTYSAIAAGIGALKGPRHGGANIKVYEMVKDIKAHVGDVTNEGEVADYLAKILNKEAGDGSGLIYGMGHAVYTLSDPRAVLLKKDAQKYSKKYGYEEDFILLDTIERVSPELFCKYKGIKKKICANVDLYSGLIYSILNIPEELFTPLFMSARIAGWSAHRLEEIISGGKIMRPAYKNVSLPRPFVPIGDRIDNHIVPDYIPSEER